MDPLSITVATIALGGTVLSSLRLLQQLHTAPKQILALIEEVVEFQTVLTDLESLLQLPLRHDCLQDEKLAKLVFAAKSTLSEIEDVITTRFLRRKSVDSEPSVRKSAWLSAVFGRLKELQQVLQVIKLNLSTMLAVSVVSRTAKIQSSIEDLSSMSRDTSNMMQEFQQNILKVFLDQSEMLQSIHTQMSSTFDGTKCMELEEKLPTYDDSSRDLVPYNGSIFPPNSLSSLKVDPLQSKRYYAGQCKCRCHRRHHFGSPHLLRRIFGNFYLEFAALSILRGDCDRKSCRQKSTAVLRITYYFPQWLALRMFATTMWLPDLQACHLTLRAPRVVPESSPVFQFARSGNITGLTKLFENGLASVHDVGVVTGAPPITYAIDNNHIETWRFLLACGADPFQINHSRQASIDIAYNKILGQSVPEKSAVAIRNDFDSEDYFEARQFPSLHLVVLKIVEANLCVQLQLSLPFINDTDWQGRTALSWAAARGDVDAVNNLLQYGADPNLCSFNGSSPLQFASRASTADCLYPLLAAGANIKHQNIWHVDALDYAIRVADDPSYILPLLLAGIDPNRVASPTPSPLSRAIKCNHFNQAQCLLQYGAAFGDSDGWGFDALVEAINRGSNSIIELLLEHSVLRFDKLDTVSLLQITENSRHKGIHSKIEEYCSSFKLSGEIKLSPPQSPTFYYSWDDFSDTDDQDIFFDALETF